MGLLVMWVSQEAKVKMGMLVFLEMLAFLAPQVPCYPTTVFWKIEG